MPSAASQLARYYAIRGLFAAATSLGPGASLRGAAALGHAFALSPFNRKRLARGLEHLRIAFPDWSEERRLDCVVRSYEHLVTLGAELSYAPRLLSEEGWMHHLGMTDLRAAARHLIGARPCVMVTGHCGNWELLGYVMTMLGFPTFAIYRPLDLRPLDAWVRRTRERRGLMLIDKFGAMRQLPGIVQAGAPVAFIADQNGGDRGIFVPFFGRLASTYKSVGLTALQFDATILCGCARRLGPDETIGAGAFGQLEWSCGSRVFRYAIELHDIIRPEDWKPFDDPLYYVTARYRRAIEAMVRRAPEQYLWMHRIWKSRPRHERLGRPFPDSLERKIRQLPWITDEAWRGIRDRSAADTGAAAGR